MTDCSCMKQKHSVDHCQCRTSVSTGTSKSVSEEKKKFKFPKYFNSELQFWISQKKKIQITGRFSPVIWTMFQAKNVSLPYITKIFQLAVRVSDQIYPYMV